MGVRAARRPRGRQGTCAFPAIGSRGLKTRKSRGRIQSRSAGERDPGSGRDGSHRSQAPAAVAGSEKGAACSMPARWRPFAQERFPLKTVTSAMTVATALLGLDDKITSPRAGREELRLWTSKRPNSSTRRRLPSEPTGRRPRRAFGEALAPHVAEPERGRFPGASRGTNRSCRAPTPPPKGYRRAGELQPFFFNRGFGLDLDQVHMRLLEKSLPV